MHSQLQSEEEVGVLEIFGGVRTEEEALAIKAGLEDLPGVETVEFVALGARIRFNPDLADEQKFYTAIREAGFRASTYRGA
jgi:copper chaperone CopZ